MVSSNLLLGVGPQRDASTQPPAHPPRVRVRVGTKNGSGFRKRRNKIFQPKREKKTSVFIVYDQRVLKS